MSALAALASGSSAAPTYVDDVFSTYLYTGNGSTQTITNGIDLAGKGGLVWIKARNNAQNNLLYDTVRGASSSLQSNSTAASGAANGFDSFTSTGFTLINDAINQSTWTYASFAFRKAAKFFDCGTFTVSGTGGNVTVNHSLGQAPGMVIIKSTDAAQNWFVWHRSLASTDVLYLNLTNATTNIGGKILNVGATSFDVDRTYFTGASYVYYAFAHDTTTDGLIQCGSVTYNSTSGNTINLGWEPQFVIIKDASAAVDWYMADTMRGYLASGNATILRPNTSGAEGSAAIGNVNATGFTIAPSLFTNNDSIIYLAIRRPNKPPTSGTQVYFGWTGNTTSSTSITSGFAPDLVIARDSRSAIGNNFFADRLRGASSTAQALLNSASTTAEVSSAGRANLNSSSDGWIVEQINTSYLGEAFRRAPGVFDVVCYTGNGTASRTISHSLGVAPEMMIVKSRGAVANWWVFHTSLANNLPITSGAVDGNFALHYGSPTATNFTLNAGANGTVNDSTGYVAYLFATKAGISKVGSYTGNGAASQTINCGFTTGARFVLIKRTSSTGGSWLVFDSVRGIVAGIDPILLLHSTIAEVAVDDSIDPDSTGFIVNNVNSLNTNGDTYIYLAFA